MAKNDHFASTYSLKPNTTYTVNNITYTTNENGNIVKFSGPVTDQAAPRSPSHQANLQGKEPGDHSSHLIAASNGGSGKIDNMVPMDGKVNTRDYRAMERENNDLIKEGKQVTLSGELHYNEGSDRPTSLMTTRTSVDPNTGKEDITLRNFDNIDKDEFTNDGTWADMADEYENPGAIVVDDQGNEVSTAQGAFHDDMVAASDDTLGQGAGDEQDEGLGQDDGLDPDDGLEE